MVINLTRAVQICVDIGSHIISPVDQSSPQAMGEVFTTLRELDAISIDTCEQLKKQLVLEISRCITMKYSQLISISHSVSNPEISYIKELPSFSSACQPKTFLLRY